MKILIAIGLCALVAGCSTTRTGSLCPLGAFYLDAGASTRLTRGEKEYVATLNTSGEAICGWKAP